MKHKITICSLVVLLAVIPGVRSIREPETTNVTRIRPISGYLHKMEPVPYDPIRLPIDPGSLNKHTGLLKNSFLTDLYLGKLDQAVEKLTRPSQNLNDAARTNLAAVLYHRAKRDQSLPDLLRALELTNDSSGFAARANRVLILNELGLSLELGPQIELLKRTKNLTPSQSAEVRQLSKRILDRPVTKQQALELHQWVEEHTQSARLWVQKDLLPAWADHFLDDEFQNADQVLELIVQVGGWLAKAGNQAIAIDAGVIKDHRQHQKSLAQGILKLVEGHSLFRSNRLSDSEKKLKTAFFYLDRCENGMKHWAQLWISGVEIHRGHYQSAIHRLRAILDKETACDPALQGRVNWHLGMALMRRGYSDRALTCFKQSISAFESAGELENQGTAWVLLADNLKFLGQERASLKACYQSLRILRRFPVSKPLTNLYLEIGKASRRSGFKDAAVMILSEALANAQKTGTELNVAEVFMQRAEAFLDTERFSLAEADIREAEQAIKGIPENELSQKSRSSLALVKTKLLLVNPQPAPTDNLDEAITFYKTRNAHLFLPGVYLARARVHLSEGRISDAEGDLVQAINHIEILRKEIKEFEISRNFMETMQTSFDLMIQLQVEEMNQPWTALSYSDRARRVLRPSNEMDHLQVNDPSKLASVIPHRTAVIHYALTGNKLHQWLILRTGYQYYSCQVSTTDIRQWAKQIEVPQFQEKLYEFLVRPFAASFSEIEELLFVPDKILGSVPFAALKVPDDDQFLVQKYSIGILPTVSSLLRPKHLPEISPQGNGTLVVGNPSFNGEEFGWLTDLPEAEREAKAVAKLYKVEPLIGRQAHFKAVTEALSTAEVFHFAGHAVSNPLLPEESYMVFAQPDDRQISGLLFPRDLRNLNLSKLRLVVLAGCNTGKGTEARTGFISNLAEPFLSSGVSAVVTSLWDLNDGATKDLMVAFHQAVKTGLSPRKALQAAQISILKRYPVRDWAGVQVMGFR